MLQDSHHHKIQVVFQSVTMHMSLCKKLITENDTFILK